MSVMDGPATRYDTYTSARTHFKDVLDVAESGRPVIVARDRAEFAVVESSWLRLVLQHSLHVQPEVSYEVDEKVWVIAVPGLPLVVEQSNLEDAVEELIEAIRDYTDAWHDHLHFAPNHRGFQSFVNFVGLNTDDQLRAWIKGENAVDGV